MCNPLSPGVPYPSQVAQRAVGTRLELEINHESTDLFEVLTFGMVSWCPQAEFMLFIRQEQFRMSPCIPRGQPIANHQ